MTVDWVEESLRVGTVLPMHPFLLSPHSKTSSSRLFRGVVVFMGPDIGPGDQEKLWAMLTWRGGKVAASLRCPGITHVITTSSMLENEDFCEVTPDWVTESCKRGKRLLEYDFCPEDYYVDCPEDVVENNNTGTGVEIKNLKRKLIFDGMEEDSDDFFSCNSTPSSVGLNDVNSNCYERIIHTPMPKRLKL